MGCSYIGHCAPFLPERAGFNSPMAFQFWAARISENAWRYERQERGSTPRWPSILSTKCRSAEAADCKPALIGFKSLLVVHFNEVLMFTPIDTTFSFYPWFLMFLLIGFGIVACVTDGITTMIGLGANKGFTEGNPIARWMFKKVGESFTVFLGAVAYTFTALIIGTHNWAAGMVYAGIVAAGEVYFTIHNYLLLKKLGIPLK